MGTVAVVSPRTLLAAVVAAAIVASACDGNDGGRRLRLVVDVEPGIRDTIDEVEVTLTSSRTDPPARLELCEPRSCVFPARGGEALPIVVDFHGGPEFGRLALFRIDWRSGGTPVARREIAAPWPASGKADLRATLSEACRAAGCFPDRQCLVRDGATECVDFQFPWAFDDPGFVVSGAGCGRSEGACPNGADADAGAGEDGDADADEDADEEGDADADEDVEQDADADTDDGADEDVGP